MFSIRQFFADFQIPLTLQCVPGYKCAPPPKEYFVILVFVSRLQNFTTAPPRDLPSRDIIDGIINRDEKNDVLDWLFRYFEQSIRPSSEN